MKSIGRAVLAAVGGVAVSLSREYISEYVKKNSSSFKISKQSDSYMYSKVLEWVLTLKGMKSSNHISISNLNRSSRFKSHRSESKYVLADGKYRSEYAGMDLIIYVSTVKMDSPYGGGRDDEHIKILAPVDKNGLLLDTIKEVLKDTFNDDKIIIESQSGQIYKHKRLFDSVVMDDADKDMLIKYLDWWRGAEPIYNSLGITYKTGILLYGPPGTGKTSLVHAIASYMDMDIYVSSNLYQISREIKENTVVLFEDVDRDLESMENTGSTGSTFFDMIQGEPPVAGSSSASIKKPRATHSDFMNILDGISSPSNVIFIMTANDITKIDEAIIRSGRIDIKLHMGEFNYDMASKMCVRHGFSPKAIDAMEENEWKSPSDLNLKLLQMKKNI